MKVYIETLGCPKNEVDSMMAVGLCKRAGYEITATSTEADVIIVNTCGFIQDAKEESIATIFDLAQLKESEGGSCKVLAVTGCLSQRYGMELLSQMPEVDLMLGVNDYGNIVELIEEALEAGKEGGEQILAPPYDCGFFEEFEGITAEVKNASAYLKISEGCNNRCTYCIIPYIRGPFRSRRPEAVLAEARDLVKKGAKELVLIAQDTTNYGADFDEDYDLADLLRELGKIEELKWIRLMYCYPDRITEKLVREIRDNPKVCKYVDMPVQHGSDVVLKRMNRKSDRADIERVVKLLRKEIPDIVIRTTIIVGFPGEKAAEFDELYDFVEEMRFDRLGVFAYSKEEDTPAALLKPQVRSDVKERRKTAIMQLQQSVSLEKNLEKVGKVFEVLVEEGPDEEGGYLGRTAYDAYEIDNGVIFTSFNKLNPGDFVKVRITDAFDYDLVGEVL